MDNQEDSNPLSSLHIPVALIALALSVLFFSQIKGVGQASDTMKWQSKNADDQTKALKENREKLGKAIEERKTLVTQSEQTQKQFTDLMKDLDELARAGDKDAKTIIDGYGIKIADNAGASEKKEEKKDDKKSGK